MAKKTKSDLVEKLSALKPHVPTSTRKPLKETDQQALKTTAKKVRQRKTATRNPVAPKIKKAERPAAPPKAGTAVQEPARMPSQEKPQPVKDPIEGMITLPFALFVLWRGIFQSWYGMAEDNFHYLLNLSFWKR